MPLTRNQACMVGMPYLLPPTGQSRDLFKPPVITAAFFADGTTTGDATLLARLMLRRGSLLQAVELTRDILSDAGGRNVSRSGLVEEFRMLANSVNHWYLPPEVHVSRQLYQSIAEKLMNLPPLQVGSPFPPIEFVNQEVATLNRQRTALMNSKPSLAETAAIRK